MILKFFLIKWCHLTAGSVFDPHLEVLLLSLQRCSAGSQSGFHDTLTILQRSRTPAPRSRAPSAGVTVLLIT